VDFINKPVAFDQMQEIFKKIEYVLQHHPKKVLIVEENEHHAKALAYFLETFNVNLEIRNEVGDAIELLKNNNVDCVILDMGVPDRQAYDTLEAVKKTPGLENLPIIIFTGKSLSQPEVMKIRQYADSIVVKTAYSYKRILDEVSLFLHLMEKNNSKDPQPPRYHKLGALDEVLKNKTVLIADDDMRNIFSLTKALEKYQMNVVAAVDGKDAFKKLQASQKVDIVLMDMMMPEMDGYETITTIRRDRKYRDLPIIAVTAKAMVGDREKCIDAGASDYITKPVDVDQLFSLLRVWLYESGKR
jgi:CheY-like chemotaxis protein